MNRAIVTAGPQGAGKTTFCKEILKHYPDVILVERDAILIELYGKTHLDPYIGGHHYCGQVMWERIAQILLEKDEVTLILDTWLGWPESRNRAGERLRQMGAEQVDLWYFTTPEEVCIKQYDARERSGWTSDWQRDCNLGCCRKNFRVFHSIKFINPMQLTFIPYPLLLV
jgi:hypothetical protein